jgi:hypothetical protein
LKTGNVLRGKSGRLEDNNAETGIQQQLLSLKDENLEDDISGNQSSMIAKEELNGMKSRSIFHRFMDFLISFSN